MKMYRTTIIILLLALLGATPLLAIGPLPFNQIVLRGELPVTQLFRVDQYEQSFNFNLVESRNSIVAVGSYTLISNHAASNFRLSIRPGVTGNDDEFSFTLDEGEPLHPGQLTELPFAVRVASDTNAGTSVAGSRSMQKELGVRGGLASNRAILFENGQILAEIPDFDPNRYATGRYSAALQLSIEVI